MNILIIIDGLPGGGAEKSVLTLSSGFLKMKHKVSLFSFKKICDYHIPKGLDFYIIQDSCKNPFRKFTEISRYTKLLDKAIAIAERNEKFDLIFSNLHKTDRIVSKSKILNHEKVWFCIHNMISFSYLEHRNKLSRWIKYLKIYRTYKNRNVIGVSTAVLRDIQDKIGIHLRRSEVIFNPFDIENIQYQAKKPFEMQGKNYLIHVGRFHESKRHDRLLRAYALSGIKDPLVMMGNGSVSKIEKLKNLSEDLKVSERVLFRKFSMNPYPWIKGAKLLVLSSDYEGFGNVLLESIICQTPVVSTSCPGGPTEILKGPLARGLSELNAKDLAKKICDIYTSPPIVDSSIAFSYDMQKICNQYLKLAENYI